MRDKCFLDSNLLVYLYDQNEPEKRNYIESFLRKIKQTELPVISTQTIGEFFNVTTKKLKYPKDIITEVCEDFNNYFPIYEISVDNVYHALMISKQTHFSYWDSLIIAVAIDIGCSVVYSEDLNSGQMIEGVKVINSFCV